MKYEKLPIEDTNSGIRIEKAPKPSLENKNFTNCITKEEIQNNPNPSRMIIVFDNSLSMMATLVEPPHEVEQFLEYISYGYPNYISE